MALPKALQQRQYKSSTVSRLWEKFVVGTLASCSALTILITVAIVVMLVSESWQFFQSEYVDWGEFVSSSEWTALQAKELEDAKFGIWPLLSGTLRVTLIAMTIALPLGLVTAIFLSEFRGPSNQRSRWTVRMHRRATGRSQPCLRHIAAKRYLNKIGQRFELPLESAIRSSRR